MNDTIQVAVANTTGIAIYLTQVNQVLTLISLTLAISYTIYKFVKYEERQD